jgi:hypothetical protein
MYAMFFFVKKEKKELLWFSLFFGFVCQKTEKRGKKKRGRRFFDHETTETFDDGTLSIHTDTRHQHHHHHGFYYCFKYRSRRGIICESSFSLVFDSSSFFSLSLSLSARECEPSLRADYLLRFFIHF